MAWPLGRPPAILGIGRNYADHAAELGNAVESEAVLFFKNPASITGNGEPIVISPLARTAELGVDYEGELAVVLGRDGRDIPESEALAALSHVAVANDVSQRWWQWQGGGGQWCRGKSFDSFCPLGEPLPIERVPDLQNLLLTTRLNGDVVQQASTATMIRPVARLVAELSRGTTLLAGTVILTGTPAGVGAARTPPRFLRHGDVVEITIEGIGTLRNPVVET